MGQGTIQLRAQGWPANYSGVMLQGFYWDSYSDTKWTNLESQADELSEYFSLIWIPQSGNCNSSGNVMGYMPVYYFDQNSSFGSEAQLRKMIKTFKDKGTGMIADVVINHRNVLGSGGSWVDFPSETYNGVTYQMTAKDICSDDDNGKTKNWANGKGISLSSSGDTGEDWNGCRDLDHTSSNVQTVVKAYLKYLLEDLGYSGFRYDMVKGFSASSIADYNVAAKPEFSVGEYWDGTGAIQQWIEYSKGYVSSTPTSAAFDFQFRYRVRDAINNANWRNLASTDMVMKTDAYKQYAVTFVENHDTEKRSGDDQDPIWSDTLQANAFLLAMPGTPCVFLKHWQAYKPEIKSMIEARKLAGITNTSTWVQKSSATNYYAVGVTGSKAELVAVVGKKSSVSSSVPVIANQYVEILSGPGYRYLLSRDANTAWIDVASGEYGKAFDVKLTAVTNQEDAKLVYTTDGTTPTATSKNADNGSTLTIDQDCTLTVGLLVDGIVSGIVSRDYVVKPFEAHKATVYVRCEPSWSTVNFYIWDSNGNTEINKSWPGKKITDMILQNGYTWYFQTLDINEEDYYFNLVVSTGTGSPQTVDVENISEDTYLVVTNQTFNGKYVVDDVTSQMATNIKDVRNQYQISQEDAIYDLTGRRIAFPQSGHLYIQNGQKFWKK